MITTRIAGAWTGVLLLIALGAGADTGHEYVGVAKCAICHQKELYGDQVSLWRSGPHAKAYETLASPKALEVASARGLDGSPQQAAACLQCHSTAHVATPALMKYDLEPSDGVQCESCHGAGADYRARDVMADRARAMAEGLVLPTPAVCTDCHNAGSPSWDPGRYALPGGKTTGFDFDQAAKQIAHPTPPERKGKVLQLEDAERAQRKKQTVR